MKTKTFFLFTAIAMLMLSFSISAQVPQKVSYQSIICNTSGELVKSSVVGLRVSIVQGTVDGMAVYTETHTATTNINGLATIEVGTGTTRGDFSTIDWGNSPNFLKVEVDPTGGTAYSMTGISEILSVPYALFSKKAATVDLETQNLFSVLLRGNDGYGYQIKNIANPTDPKDVATKAYVDKLKDKATVMENMLIDAGLYTVKDIDGNIYNTVKIGSQLWMSSNLMTTKLNDGTPIFNATDASVWSTITAPGYCWYANNQSAYASTRGALYNWYTVETGKLCPAGWHVPQSAEWDALITYLGGVTVAGGKLKEAGTSHWTGNDAGSNNETKFTALPGGYRMYDGLFYSINTDGRWWSINNYDETDSWYFYIHSSNLWAMTMYSGYRYGFSVRCLRDEDNGDNDADMIPNSSDNCINTYNPDQADANYDGIGDACE